MPAKNKKNKHIKVNLIPKSEFENTYTGRILTWILGSFRFIVILVEIVVISGFATRFWLDMRHSELNDQIKRKTAVINDLRVFEETFKRVQRKQEIYSSASSKNHHFTPIIENIIKHIPDDVKLSSIKSQGSITTISVIGLQERSIIQFLVNLQQESMFENLSIKSINTNKDTPYFEYVFENITEQSKKT